MIVAVEERERERKRERLSVGRNEEEHVLWRQGLCAWRIFLDYILPSATQAQPQPSTAGWAHGLRPQKTSIGVWKVKNSLPARSQAFWFPSLHAGRGDFVILCHVLIILHIGKFNTYVTPVMVQSTDFNSPLKAGFTRELYNDLNVGASCCYDYPDRCRNLTVSLTPGAASDTGYCEC